MGQADLSVLSSSKLNVALSMNPFGVGNVMLTPDLGSTIKEILEDNCPDLIQFKPYVFIDDHLIKPEYYHVVRPKAGSIISIRIATMGGGGGGKNPLRTILSLAVMAAGAYFAGAFAPALANSIFGGGLATTGSQIVFASSLIKGAIGLTGNLLINALAPPAKPKVSSNASTGGQRISQDTSQTYFIQGATNKLRPFDPIPSLLGIHRIVPPQATQPYNELSGDIFFARQSMAMSLGKIVVERERIGETAFNEFAGITQEDRFDGNLNDPSMIIPGIVNSSQLNINLTSKDNWSITQTTAPNCDEFEVQISYPEGLMSIADGGGKVSYPGGFSIRYAPTGTTSWVQEDFLEQRATNAAFAVAKRFLPGVRGQYDVQIIRQYDESGSLRALDTMVWSGLRSYQNEAPINEENVSGKNFRIQGSDQLNGPVEQYNALAKRLLPDWNGTEWVDDQITNNCASILRHILKAEEAKDQIPDDEIHYESLIEFHDFCREKGLAYNSYIDYSADREDLIKEVCAAGLATPALIDNKYGVVIDTYKNKYTQHISQRNSFNYTYEKVFNEFPHAFRVALLNEDKDYLQDEIIVYNTGYDSTNATSFVQWDFPGVTNTSNIYILSRHRMAEMQHRPDMHQVTMDIEYMVAKKGDKVKFSHDVALIGISTGRVKELLDDGAGNLTGLVVDEECPMLTGETYSIEVRTEDLNEVVVAVVNNPDEKNTLMLMTPVPLSVGINVGDLFSFGKTDSVTIDALIHSVKPINDEMAVVNLINYAPEIFQSYEGTIPTYDNNLTLTEEFQRPFAPELVSIASDQFVQIENLDGSLSSRAVINLRNRNSIPVGVIVKMREIGETDYREADVTTITGTKIAVEGLEQGKVYDFKVFYRRSANQVTGVLQTSLPLDINGHTFIGTSENPPDITALNIVVRGEGVYLEWEPVVVYDLKNYEIRFSSEIGDDATWGNSIVFAEFVPKEQTQIAIPSAVGTYLIRAVDRQGDKSPNATKAVTNIGKLLELNVIETIPEHTHWGGTFDATTLQLGALMLGSASTIDDWTMVDDIGDWDTGDAGIAALGYYYFRDTQDLGAVYDCVISTEFEISGQNITDLIDSWMNIDDRPTWDGANPDEYKVQLQVRTTDTDPSLEEWSIWKNVVVGEYTARAFQFRLVLTSTVSDVTPVVISFTVKIDMPDRDERGYVASSGTGVYEVLFEEPFRVPPVVLADANNMTTTQTVDGPYDVTTHSFKIAFRESLSYLDKSFSWHAKGYGRSS